MDRRTRFLAISLAATAWLALGDAHAQAHGPPATEFLDVPEPDTPATHAAKVAEIDAFLRRLVGRFRDTRGAGNYSEKLVDCVAIGSGPGVQCMYGLGSRSATGGAGSAQLFGIDTNAAKVNFLRVNTKGIPEGAMGRLSGDTLYLKFPCTIPPDSSEVISCETRLQYYAVARNKEVGITTTTIMRIMTRKGIQELRGDTYTWLSRAMAANGGKDDAAGK